MVIGESKANQNVVLHDAAVVLDSNAASTVRFAVRNDGPMPIATFRVRATITGADGKVRGFKSAHLRGPIGVGEERKFRVRLERWVLDEQDSVTLTLMATHTAPLNTTCTFLAPAPPFGLD